MTSFRVHFGRPRLNEKIKLPAKWSSQVFHNCKTEQDAIDQLRREHAQGNDLLIGLVEDVVLQEKGNYIIDGKPFFVRKVSDVPEGKYVVVIKDPITSKEAAYFCSKPTSYDQLYYLKLEFLAMNGALYLDVEDLAARSYLLDDLTKA
ncbi:TPA: hypothetical protein I7151_21715 [Vibrio vulnificus]|nr:hypothetical protein [Vibrio vulnificus]HDY7657900.1 hypothetical protein [Vibrio vulnificus]